MRVAVVGGTGTIGRLVVEELEARGHEAVALSRNPPKDPHSVTHRRIDLSTGAGLPEALLDIDAVVDAANFPSGSRRARDVMVQGSRRLLDAEARAGVGHHVLISIVGIERVPLGYYKVKLEQEKTLVGAEVPTSVLRATQFHQLIDAVFESVCRVGLLPVGRIRLQPIDPAEVARALVDGLEGGRWTDRREIAGPQVLTLSQLASTWLNAKGGRPLRVAIPALGRAGRALKAGALTSPEAERGTVTFEAWLASRR